MSENHRTLWDVEDVAESYLRDWFKSNPTLAHDEDAIYEAIWEAADSSVPVYTADLLYCALDNLWLATEVPDDYTGEVSAFYVISANLFAHLREHLEKKIDEIRDEVLGGEEDEDVEENALFSADIDDLYILTPMAGVWLQDNGDVRWNLYDSEADMDVPCVSFWNAFNIAVGAAHENGFSSVEIRWTMQQSQFDSIQNKKLAWWSEQQKNNPDYIRGEII